MQEAKVRIYKSCSLVALCCNLNLQAQCPEDRLGAYGHLCEPEGKKNKIIYSVKSLPWPASEPIEPIGHCLLELVFPLNL